MKTSFFLAAMFVIFGSTSVLADPPVRPVPDGVYAGDGLTLWVNQSNAYLYRDDDVATFPELIMNYKDEFSAKGTEIERCLPRQACPQIMQLIQISGVYVPGSVSSNGQVAPAAINLGIWPESPLYHLVQVHVMPPVKQ